MFEKHMTDLLPHCTLSNQHRGLSLLMALFSLSQLQCACSSIQAFYSWFHYIIIEKNGSMFFFYLKKHSLLNALLNVSDCGSVGSREANWRKTILFFTSQNVPLWFVLPQNSNSNEDKKPENLSIISNWSQEHIIYFSHSVNIAPPTRK